jgi:hypothetical protein
MNESNSGSTSSHCPGATESLQSTTDRQAQGWQSWVARFCMAVLLFEVLSGLLITIVPFNATAQWSVLLHSAVGALTLLPLAYYCATHWWRYRNYAMSQIVLLGHVALWALVICCVSGAVLTWQGLFGLRTSPTWRMVHLVTTFVTLIGMVPHIFGLPAFYSGTEYVNEFPDDYQYLYGTNRPFAPSLAQTDTGGAFDERSLAGSMSCGTVGCHEQILQEWKPSAHRWSAMDTIFQGIQSVMAKQNGPESTRYCGGCHDPISLFSGSKNIFVDNLTGSHGYEEGVSCLSCHAIRETDVKGNANYTMTQPREYLWQWEDKGVGGLARNFLIRAYPDEHNKLSKRMFKKPEYCAACHKQFIDQEVNRVGWVQLQNQYDNWAASHWNQKGDPTKTLECRECHMPLVDSHDPASGDSFDYNRNPDDQKHRSHRFIASNQLMPMMLKVEGWEEQMRLTEQWLQGKFPIAEIADKWAEGPIVKLALNAPESVPQGEPIPLRVVMASNKVGHDFPTGPLDIIQSWLKVEVKDDQGRAIFSSGKRDEKHFIEPGTFLFKAEPVDQHGNLIDRHNLWEMVGVRYRRALFPGYSDSVQYMIQCPSTMNQNLTNNPAGDWNQDQEIEIPGAEQPGSYHIEVALLYRKVDQFLLNFLFGETNTITSPISEIARASATVKIALPEQAAATSPQKLAAQGPAVFPPL